MSVVGRMGRGEDRRARRVGGGSETLQTASEGPDPETAIPAASPETGKDSRAISPYVTVNFL